MDPVEPRLHRRRRRVVPQVAVAVVLVAAVVGGSSCSLVLEAAVDEAGDQVNDELARLETELRQAADPSSPGAATDEAIPDELGVPLPPGGTVEIVSVFDDGGRTVVEVSVRYPGDRLASIADFYLQHFADWPLVERFDLDSSEGRFLTFSDPDGLLVSVQEDRLGVLLTIRNVVDR